MPLENLLHVKARAEAEILARIISASAPAQAPDELVDVKEVAQRLHVSTDYVYDHADEFPFTVPVGRKLLFSSHGIDAYIRSQQKNDSLTAKQHKRKISLV